MAQDSNASDPPTDPKDREALAAIARKIAQSKTAASEPGNGIATAMDGDAPADGETGLAPLPASDLVVDPEAVAGLLEILPGGVALCAAGRLVRCNAAFALAFGYGSAAELMEAGGLGAVLPDFDPRSDADPEAPAENGGRRALTLEGRSRSGRRFRIPAARQALEPGADAPIVLVLHPEPDQQPERDEAPAGTADRAAPPERAVPPKPSRILPHSQTANLEFLAKVSHEVRTPLNSIIGFADLMREQRFGPLASARYRGYVNDIYESGIYALSLINDLLDISKLEAGKFELNFTAVDANEVILESVQAMQPQARQGRVVLRLSLADALPPILADRRSLKQILLNLISNAIKFTEARGQVVVASQVDAKGRTHLTVRDSGVGMSEDDIAQAMEPFGQLDTAPRKQVGTGLGLPLTKALAEANRALFELESDPGRGTRIDIVFPADRRAGGDSVAAARD